jgi:UPF0755 protein
MAEVSKTKLAFFLVLSTLTITFIFYGYQILYTANILVDKEDKVFIIHAGTSYRKIQEDLGSRGFVNDMVSFSFLARLSGYDKEIVPGRYILKRNMTNLQALRILKSGKQEVVKVTFSYVRLRSELVQKMTQYAGMSPQELDEAIDDFVKENKEGFTNRNVVCMFLPNTYEVYFNILPEDLVKRMNAEYKKFWNEERSKKAKALELTPIEVSILASIVQAETVKQDEAPKIAGLYLNRLRIDMALQADPTLVFAAGDFTIKRVLNEHKEIDSPYNTYKYPGLPPGPINVPQVASIEAVLNADPNKFLYMCAKEDFSGYHNFAKTHEEHQVNARKYQRALSAEMKKAAEQKSK